MNDITFLILRIATTIIALVVACYVIPALKQAISNIKDENLQNFVQNAVLRRSRNLKAT